MNAHYLPSTNGAGLPGSTRALDCDGTASPPFAARALRLLATPAVPLALMLAVTGCGLGETAAGDVRQGQADTDAMQVIMEDDAFRPEVLEFAADTPVTVEVRNEGEMNHNFTIEALNLSTGPMEPGDVMTVTFTPPAGTSEFICTWHPGMVGRIEAK